MNIAEDCNELLNSTSQYGIPTAVHTFKNATCFPFIEANLKWQDIGSNINLHLEKQYAVDHEERIRPSHHLPLLYFFRETYRKLFSEMPQTLDECQNGLDDAFTTLRTLASIEKVTPSSPPERHSEKLNTFTYQELESRKIQDFNPSILSLERTTIQGWSERRAAKILTPWDLATFVQVLQRKGEIVGTMLSDPATGERAGHYVLRNGTGRGTDLIGLSASERLPGSMEMLVIDMLRYIGFQSIKRLNFAMEETHGGV